MLGNIGKYSKVAVALAMSVLVSLAVLGGEAQAQAGGEGSDPIVGTWVFVVTSPGQPNFVVYETYAPGGALSAIDNQVASSLETVAIGSWRKASEHKYYEEQWQFLYNPDGSFYGTWIGQIEDDMDDTGTKILPSPFTYKIIDSYGNVIATGSGTSSGHKLPKPKEPQQ